MRSGGAGYVRGHECVDVRSDLESCGGCVADDAPANGERSAGGGRDCSAIPHVDSVTCSGGACVIGECLCGSVRGVRGVDGNVCAGRCEQGFSVSADGARCVRSLSVQAAYYRRRTGM